MTAAPDDRELRDDKGQLCVKCGTNFKYQYLYDDHLPCLRGEVERLERALVAAHTEVEALKAEQDHRVRLGDATFEKGYDQAAREIRDHFAKAGDHGVVHVIEGIWKIAFEKGRPS